MKAQAVQVSDHVYYRYDLWSSVDWYLWLIPLIDISIDILIDTQSVNTRSALDQECWSIVGWVSTDSYMYIVDIDKKLVNS